MTKPGLPKKYAKMGFKKGWKAYKASKGGSSRPKSKASKSKGGKSNMGKRRGFGTQKLFKLVRLAALALPAAEIAMSGRSNAVKISDAKAAYFGVGADGIFRLSALAKGWTPYLASIAVTYGIPKIAGLIRGL